MTAALALFLLVASSDRPGFLGFGFTMHSDDKSQWLVVRYVVPGGPADRAQLAPLDVITEINGKRLRFRDDLDFLEFLARVGPGQRLRLAVLHKQKRESRVIEAAVMSDDAYDRWRLNRDLAKRKRAATPRP
jgi:S1-C subfamily serine protease